MPYKRKAGRPVVPKVTFQLKSGGFFQVFVKDEAQAKEIVKRWDAYSGETWFHPTPLTRVLVSEVVAVAYVGPTEPSDGEAK